MQEIKNGIDRTHLNIINNTNLEFYCLFNGGLFVIMIL